MKSIDLQASHFNKSDPLMENTLLARVKSGKQVDMFLTNKECLNEVLKDPLGAAVMGTLQTLLRYKEFTCDVLATPVTDYPNYISMAVARGSPLKQFLNFALLKYKENGGLEYLKYILGCFIPEKIP